MHLFVENKKMEIIIIFCDENFRYINDIGNHGYTITSYSGINIPIENIRNKNPVSIQ